MLWTNADYTFFAFVKPDEGSLKKDFTEWEGKAGYQKWRKIITTEATGSLNIVT